MIREFVSTGLFDRQWNELGLSEDDRMELETYLVKNPLAGDVIPGTYGLRKLRIPLNGKGTRGGGRVVYIDFCQHEKLYLMMVYGKNEKTNLTSDEKKKVCQIIKELEKQLMDC